MSQTSMRPSRDLDASRPPARKRRLSMASQCCAPLSDASSCRCVLRSGPAFKDGRAKEPKSAWSSCLQAGQPEEYRHQPGCC